jgi:hypothetical protein
MLVLPDFNNDPMRGTHSGRKTKCDEKVGQYFDFKKSPELNSTAL